jgi:nucleoside-diphosphate-sugar epimerase
MWVLVGCGYVGTVVAQRLVAAGEEVVATARRAAPAISGARGLLFDDATAAPLPVEGATVVWLAPPRPDVARLGEVARAARRFVYVSSTGVYGPAGGAWVDETAALAPITASGKLRVIAEAALPAGAAILRVAGIYGPGRGLVDRLRAGTYRIIGDGSHHVSRVHVDDLATAIVAAGRSEIAGAVNIADDDPAAIGEVGDALAERLGLPAPPRVAPAAVDPEVAGMLTADRRIANGRMKRELGVALRFPSWRDGAG